MRSAVRGIFESGYEDEPRPSHRDQEPQYSQRLSDIWRALDEIERQLACVIPSNAAPDNRSPSSVVSRTGEHQVTANSSDMRHSKMRDEFSARSLQGLKDGRVGPARQIGTPPVDPVASRISSKPDASRMNFVAEELNRIRQGLEQNDSKAVRSDYDASAVVQQVAGDYVSAGRGPLEEERHPEDTFGHVCRELQKLRTVMECRLEAEEAVLPRMKQLTRQFDSVRLAIDDLPHTDTTDRIEFRLDQLSERILEIDEAARQQTRANEDRRLIPANGISSIEDRLDEVTRALIALSNTGRGEPVLNISSVERIEARLTELARKTDAIARQNNGAEVAQLGERIGQLTGKLESLDGLARSVERQGAGTIGPLGQARALEQQIRQLSQQMEDVASTQSSSAQIASLEAQIGLISRQLEDKDDFEDGNADKREIASRLDQIEQKIQSGKEFSPETARNVADRIVSKIRPLGQVDQSISALAKELDGLRKISERGAVNSEQLARKVEKSFTGITSRLQAIEGTIESSVREKKAHPVFSTSENWTTTARYKSGDSPSRKSRPSAELVMEIPPSSKLRDDLATGDAKLEDEELRPDAITAARRALRATAAEMSRARLDKDGSAANEKVAVSGKNWGNASLRKPLALGAAALLLSIVTFKGIALLDADKNGPVAELDTPSLELEGELDRTTTSSIDRDIPDAADRNHKRSIPSTVPGSIVAPPGVIPPNRGFSRPAGEINHSQGQSPKEGAAGKKVEEEDADPLPLALAIQELTPDIGPAALIEAAASGDPKAQFLIGMRYSSAEGDEQDMAKAAKWFTYSAQAGFAPAQFSIGSMYQKGLGVEPDIAKAADWYRKAAAQGNARAMHNLAVTYAMGDSGSGQGDIASAFKWFQKAAELGISDSQYNLGILHGQGTGVPRNLIEAYKWFSLAAKSGDAGAAKKRDEVAGQMSLGDLTIAKRQMESWQAEKLNDAANIVRIPDAWKSPGKRLGNAADPTIENSPDQRAQTL